VIDTNICIQLISIHESLFLLKNALALPNLLYTLRTVPCFQSTVASDFNEAVKKLIIDHCLNVQLNPAAQNQALLPARWGGLGVRSTVILAPSAFLSSITATGDLASSVLLLEFKRAPVPQIEEAISAWRSLGGTTAPSPENASLQRNWNNEVCSSRAQALLQSSDIRGKLAL
jgi:hypothetical protein